MPSRKNVCIIGGTSGLGLALAQLLVAEENSVVYISGRKEPDDDRLVFLPLAVNSGGTLGAQLDDHVAKLPFIDLFIYAAGYFQDGLLTDLADEEIDTMLQVGIGVPAKILKRLLTRQKKLDGVIIVTSTSQVVPRLREPLYAAVKAGVGMLAESLSLDARIGKTLVVAPAGMRTKFWTGEKRSGVLLDPSWVARRTLKCHNADNFSYCHVLVLRDPPRMRVLKKR